MASVTDSSAQVVAHIHGLHRDRDLTNVRAHSSWLEAFRQTPEAWTVLHELLTKSNGELEQHFAAHTLVAKLQVGSAPSGVSCLQQCTEYLLRFRDGPTSVRNQIAVALVDYVLWRPAEEDMQWFATCVQHFSNSPAAALCLLLLVAAIPVEAANRSVIVNAQRRQVFASNMIQQTSLAIEVLTKAAQTDCTFLTPALQACAKWLQLQHASPALRALKQAARTSAGGLGPYTADIVKHGALHEQSLLQQAAKTFSALGSAPLDLLRACTEVLSEAAALTNEVTPQSRHIQVMVMGAVVNGSRQLLPAMQTYLDVWLPPESDLAARAMVLGSLVCELGGVFTRICVSNAQDMAEGVEAMLGELADVALKLCMLRHTDIAKCGLDFWYSVITQHLGAGGEERDPLEDETATCCAPGTWKKEDSSPDEEGKRRQKEIPILTPHMHAMVKAHWQAVRYPAEPELTENFIWDDFLRFRELCSMNVTEACSIISASWVIEHVGSLLNNMSAKQQFPWQDIDACIFILTAIASRAPAGQDTVIPKLLELLPVLPYPSKGFKALLLRTAACRLIQFTSGYLARHIEPCKLILRFLALQHLPSIPLSLAEAPCKDSKKYCEHVSCDSMKVVLTTARKIIVQADGGSLWRSLIQAILAITGDQRLGVECRAQLIFGAGQIMSEVDDWSEMEHTLGLVVSHVQETVNPLLAALPPEPLGARAVKRTHDEKSPAELRLYIAAVSCVYNIPITDNLIGRPQHPVLRVVEQHFQIIEKVCLHHSQYEDLMEQVCLAFQFILSSAREHVPTAAVFVPIMKLMARCCGQHPQHFYMGLVKNMIGIFAPNCDMQMDAVLIDLVSVFIMPVVDLLVRSSPSPLLPAINAAAYDMLTEALRQSNLVRLATKSPWLHRVLAATVEVLPQLAEGNLATYEKTVGAMLRCIRGFLVWCTSDIAGDIPERTELMELQQQAQMLVTQASPPNPPLLSQLPGLVVKLTAAAALHKPASGEVVPSAAEVLRMLLLGPSEYGLHACSQLPIAVHSLPSPLCSCLNDNELQRLIQQLKMEKGDSKRFIKMLVGVAEQFAASLKNAHLGSAQLGNAHLLPTH